VPAQVTPRNRPRRLCLRLATVLLAAGAALLVTACGSGSKSGTTGGSNSGTAANASGTGSCGTIPTQMPADPNKLLASLPARIRPAYNGLPITVEPSAWAHWKPKHGPPYKVGVEFPNNNTPFGAGFINRVQQLGHQNPKISQVVVRLANNSVPTQVRQLNELIRDRVDIIIGASLASQATAPVVQAAQKAGIPYVEFTGIAPGPGAIGFFTGQWEAGAQMAQALARFTNGKGRVLMMHGIPQTQVDQVTFAGANAVFKNCPGIKTVGNLVGQFAPPVAKGVTLQYLSANPQPVNGAFQTAGMAVGILQAFQQLGREVPPIADQGATPGFLAYWNAHKDSYKAFATGNGTQTTTDLVWDIAMRTLAGGGPKLNNIFLPAIPITNDNVAEWVKPGWTASTVSPAYAEPPNRDLLVTDKEWDAFFNNPNAGAE
jgi:ribose transport system substrate-binding protein